MLKETVTTSAISLDYRSVSIVRITVAVIAVRAYRDVRLPSPPWNLRGLGEGQTKSRNILTRCVHGQWIDFRHAMYMVSGEVMSLAYQRPPVPTRR